ncbi:MAG: formyltransferase family protein [Cyanobacteria bacterium J06621_12]
MEQIVKCSSVSSENIKNWKTLFIGDKSNWSYQAGCFIQSCFPNIDLLFWERGDAIVKLIDTWSGEQIISFKSDLILPQQILDRTYIHGINFHPAPPIYRGIGGYNYALLNKDKHFGVTCHHMVKEIDFGQIIETNYFPILPDETASSLKDRSGYFCLKLLQKIVEKYLLTDVDLPVSQSAWGERLYTTKELNRLRETTNSLLDPNWLR